MNSVRHLHFPVFVGMGVLLGGLGCQGYTFEQKCPEGITESQLTVPAAKPVPADILFVVDNSASMADEQANLAANFEFFINQIVGSGDYQIAIVSTDQDSSGGEREGQVSITYDDTSSYRPLSGINGDSCGELTALAHGCFRGPNPARRIIRSSQPKEEQISDFQANVDVGSCGSGNEAGLKSMRSALQQTAPNQCNEGFLRDDANLVIIFVSDEEDTDNTQISQYVQDLAAFKDPSQVRIAAIIGSVDGDASDCSINEGAACGSICETPPTPGSRTPCTPGATNSCPAGEYCDSNQRRCENSELQYWNNENCSWCTYYDVADCCSAKGGSRYVRFARAVEDRIVSAGIGIDKSDCKAPEGTRSGCLVDSICQDNFGATLERIAKDLVVSTSYRLSPAPENPEGVAVRVTGGRFGEGVDLVYGEDFTISLIEGEDAAQLDLTSGEKTPSMENEELDVAFVSDISKPTVQKGACGPQTSTTALSQQ